MKSKYRYTVILFLIIFLFSYTTVSAQDEKEQAIKYINLFRKELDLPPVKSNSDLDKAARQHSIYMDKYDILTHEENKNNHLFVGVYPLDRAAYYLYFKPYVTEFISENKAGYQYMVNEIINDPYKRISLFNPMYQDVGMGQNNDKYTIELGGERNHKSYQVKYPLENQLNVNNINTRQIKDNPYEGLNLSVDTVGVPVTYSIYSTRNLKNVNIQEAYILDKETDEKLDIKLLTPDTDEYLDNTIMLLPLEPYKYDTEYEVYIKGTAKTIKTEQISARWIFSTESTKGEGSNNLHLSQKITRQRFVEEIVKTLGIKTYDLSVNQFRDVPEQSSYAKYIYTLKKLGIINGYPDNTFKPKDSINRESALVVMMRMYDYVLNKDYNNMKLKYDKTFQDIDEVSPWARKAVQSAYEMGIIRGRENNVFDPKADISYEEAYLLIQRIQEVINGKK